MGRLLVLFLLIVPVGMSAQNSDVAFLTGTSPSFDRGVRIGWEVTYARQFWAGRFGRLYFEAPVIIPLAPPDGGPNEIHIFVTPGIRYHFNVTPRVALYASAGVGFTTFANTSQTEFADDIGVGVDFRLSRRWSLRGDVRTFPKGGLDQGSLFELHSPIHSKLAMVGVAVHF